MSFGVEIYADGEPTVDFRGSIVIGRRQESAAVRLSGIKMVANGRIDGTGQTFPLPMPGPHWRGRMYWSLCWYFGRRGRGR
jgi:hypothetical protein